MRTKAPRGTNWTLSSNKVKHLSLLKYIQGTQRTSKFGLAAESMVCAFKFQLTTRPNHDRQLFALPISKFCPNSASMAGAMFSNALKSFSSNISANYYEKSASPISHCGPWKIYDAKKKKTNQPVSIFVFERRSLDNGSGSLRGGLNSREGLKTAQDEAVERLKCEASLLARLRHPCILELVEPVEETRSGGLQFVTEPVTGSLATLLKEKDEEERSGGSRYVQNDDGRRRRREVEIDELEIQKGLLQLGKALEFLHESANLIHGNLTPDAVIVNAKVRVL